MGQKGKINVRSDQDMTFWPMKLFDLLGTGLTFPTLKMGFLTARAAFLASSRDLAQASISRRRLSWDWLPKGREYW